MSNLRAGPAWLTPDLIRRVIALAERPAVAPMAAEAVAMPEPARERRRAAISLDCPREELPPELAQPAANDAAAPETPPARPLPSAPRVPPAKLPLPRESTMESRFARATVAAPKPMMTTATRSLADEPLDDRDREAFRRRGAQRRSVARAAVAPAAPSGPVTGGTRTRYLYEKVRAENMTAERAAAEHRASDPVERARTFLQRKGLVICRADVVGGRKEHWAVSGRGKAVTDIALLDLATSKGFEA